MASEALFRHLIEHALDGVVVVDRDVRLIYASPAARTLVGATGDLRGTGALGYVHPEDVPVLAALAGDQFDGAGYVLPMRFRVGRADGEVRHVEAVSVDLSDDPAVGGLLLQLRDVTLAGEITPAGATEERRFQRMLEHVADTFVLLDADRRIVTSAGAGRDLFGGPGERVDLTTAAAVCHPEDAARLRAGLRGLADGAAFTIDVRFPEPSGEWTTHELRGTNHLDDPVIRGLVVIGRDVTAARAADGARAEAHAQMERALEQRREFVATVSHELRTPLHGIMGVAELLADARHGPEVAELADLVTRSASSLLHMVDDILDLSRLEIGRLELAPRAVDVAELVSDVVGLASRDPSGPPVSLRCDRDVPPALADPGRVRQILTAMVGRALAVSTAGGVAVSVAGRADGVVVTVVDTGPPLGQQERDALFAPFAGGGAGGVDLSLPIGERLASAMGGSLRASSPAGKGTTLTLVVPPAPGPEVASGRAPEGDDRPLVLVVEDDPTSQVLVDQQLARLGCRCVVVPDGEAALEAWRRVQPALVLVDERLPGIDGRETTRRLRELEVRVGRPRTAVAAVTASRDAEAAWADTDVDEVLVKPVRLAALGDALARLLAR